jgi:hypothetical protein
MRGPGRDRVLGWVSVDTPLHGATELTVVIFVVREDPAASWKSLNRWLAMNRRKPLAFTIGAALPLPWMKPRELSTEGSTTVRALTISGPRTRKK